MFKCYSVVFFMLSNVLLATPVSNTSWNDFLTTEEVKAKVYPQEKVIGSEHLLFNTIGDANNWAKKVAPIFSGAFGAKRFEVLNETDFRRLKLQKYVHELWPAFLALYPTETASLNEPPVILVDSEVVNAFVANDPQTHKVSHAIIVFTGYLDLVGGIEEQDTITGTMAHELAHSVFRHALPFHQKEINHFFLNGEETLGFRAQRNKSLDISMATWVESSKSAGDLTYPELLELPSYGLAQPLYLKIWKQLQSQLSDKSAACERAIQKYGAWSSLIDISGLESAFVVLEGNFSRLKVAGQELINAEEECFAGKKPAFIEVFSQVTGVPAAALKNNPEIMMLANNWDSSESAMTGVRRLVGTEREKMLNVEKQFQFSQLGYYTYEEHADDVSVFIHEKLGKNPLANSMFLEKYLRKNDPKSAAMCDVLLRKGQAVPSGSFSDPHRSTCYRVSHSKALVEDYRASSVSIDAYSKQYMKLTVGENK